MLYRREVLAGCSVENIWHSKPDIAYLKEAMQGDNIMRHLGLKITEIGEDYLRGTMPADYRTFQVYGVVHGGANVVLAETLGSFAGGLTVDRDRFQVFGQEVSATHIRSVSSGLVTGTARPVHLGSRSQVWEIRLENDEGKLTCLCKLILAVVPVRVNR